MTRKHNTAGSGASCAALSDKEQRERWRPTEECRCPVCTGMASRIRRRPIDVLTGLFHLFRQHHRYRCRSIGCDWQGNRTVQVTDSALIGWR